MARRCSRGTSTCNAEFARKDHAIFQAVKAKKMLPEDGIAAMHELCIRFNLGPYVEEHKIYGITLLERMHLGDLTRAQAIYMDAQKRFEMTERERVANAEAKDLSLSPSVPGITVYVPWDIQPKACRL